MEVYGLAVDVKQDRVLPGRVEVRGLDHPAVEGDATAHVHLEELDGGLHERENGFRERPVVFEDTHDLMAGQPHELCHRRLVEGGERVKGVSAVGGNVVGVRAGGAGRRDALGLALPV